MAVDTIGVTQAADFIPEIWAREALPFLRANIVVASRVARDTDIAAERTGDTLNIPYPGTFHAHSKTAGTEYTIQQPANADTVAVVLNKHEEVSYNLEDIVRAEANQDLMLRYGEAAGIALSEKIESDLIAAMQACDNDMGSYGTALDAADFVAGWKALTDLKVPQDQRYALISTKDYAACLVDEDLVDFIAANRPTAVSQANLGPLYGFDTFTSQLITTSAATPAETNNLFWRRDGVMLAMRSLPEPPANTGARSATVRDPESGLVLRVLMGYDIRLGGIQVTYDVLYGVKILEQAKVLLVKS
jgi:hypothetical protein